MCPVRVPKGVHDDETRIFNIFNSNPMKVSVDLNSMISDSLLSEKEAP